MAWEKRGDRRYYYRVRRTAGRITKQYFKSGAVAEAAARQDLFRRAADEVGTRYARRIEDEMQPLDTLLDRLHDSVDQLVNDVLKQNRFYKHHGSWRTNARNQNPET